MPTPGNTSTTTALAVLNQIRVELSAVKGLSDGNVFIAADAVFLGTSYAGDQYIQIVPGAALDSYADVGLGFVDEEVRLVIYRRLLTDRAGDDAVKIAGSSSGLLELVDRIDDVMVQNFLRDRLIKPLVPIRREPGRQVPMSGSGWAVVERVYGYGYKRDYAAPQSLVS